MLRLHANCYADDRSGMQLFVKIRNNFETVQYKFVAEFCIYTMLPTLYIKWSFKLCLKMCAVADPFEWLFTQYRGKIVE